MKRPFLKLFATSYLFASAYTHWVIKSKDPKPIEDNTVVSVEQGARSVVSVEHDPVVNN